MILKFNQPISIEEARSQYNDNVKFLSNTESYPKVYGIEFDVNPQRIFKRKAIDPKITKKANKIVSVYSKAIERKWDKIFIHIIQSINSIRKQDEIKLTQEEKNHLLTNVDELTSEIQSEASKRFKEAYKLGKMRGQIMSNQELDDDISNDEDAIIEDKLDENEEYLLNFSKDLKLDLNAIMEQPYEDYDQLINAVKEKQKSKKSRMLMYALAALGLVVAGTIYALKQADESLGHTIVHGGYWIIHPDEGKGGPVCDGCEKNNGKWFSLDEFESEHGTNECLTNCRCDLDTI